MLSHLSKSSENRSISYISPTSRPDSICPFPFFLEAYGREKSSKISTWNDLESVLEVSGMIWNDP